MIVSGFTQKRSSFPEYAPAELEGQHSHCIRCCKATCNKFADQVTSCEMITCKLCGWRCHRCKQPEHVLACPEEKVNCVNKEYGCPHLVKRSKMASHLPVCPASVVCCSEEWSRWPMHARENGVRLPLPETKTYIDCGQLDIGLAMRDQRMLIDSLRAPKKLRRTLRNALTQKYPAAPFTPHSRSHELDMAASSDTSHTISDDESGTPWDLTKPPPGLSESIKSKLFLVTKETTDNLALALGKSASVISSSQDRLSGVPTADGTSDDPHQPLGLSFRSSSLPPDHTFGNRSAKDTAVNFIANSGNNTLANHMQSEAVAALNDDTHHALPSNISMCQNPDSSENTTSMTCSQGEGLRVPGQPQGGLAFSQPTERSVRSSVSSDRSDRISELSSRSRSTLQDIGGTQLYKLLGQNYGEEDGKSDSEKDQQAEPEICLHKLLGVNIGFECINKYMYKSPSMYNFICAQNFRRDEYRWHFKNVHQDIHQGSQGWLQQRCPLAYLGCTFSFTRLEPAQPGMGVYHSWLQESFGLRSTESSTSYLYPTTVQSGQNDSLPSEQPITVPKKYQYDQNSSCTQNLSSLSLNNPFPGSNIEHENAGVQTKSDPSISNLHDIDKDFDFLPGKSTATCSKGQDSESIQQTGTVEGSWNGDYNSASDRNTNKQRTEESSQPSEVVTSPKLRMRVRPTIYTAMNWDSKVLFEYEVEEDEENKRTDAHINILDLPYELLQAIAKHLDSFSLCNLALTSCLLRDVCCSLLDDHGIVLLNWQRQKSGNDITWKVVNKRWMFSTSFEPIRSWRFKPNVPHMGDHLKVCPFNKDIQRHSGRIQVMEPF